MKKKTKIALSVSALVIIAIIVIIIAVPKKKEWQWNTQVIEKGVVELSVTATGYVQPVDKVEVGTQVSGEIKKIFVDFNDRVTKGQLLAELDKQTLNERLQQTLTTETSALANLTLAEQTFNRTSKLYEANAATLADYESATSQLAQAKAQYQNAQTNVREARVNLSYAEIYSPIDGVVLDRKVEVGQTVASSFSTPTMFIIAQDLKRMKIEANVDEADIGQVREGQKVTFTVDAYPTMTFEGSVSQIRLQPTVTNNVVTYTVIIEAPNPEEKLYPNMTASVTIITQSVEAPVVAMEALNFTPSIEFMMQQRRMNKGEEPAPEMDEMALFQSQKEKVVWVKNGDDFAPRHITTDINDGVNAIITSGLNEGDTVVLSINKIEKEKKRTAANSFAPKPPKKR